MILNRCYTRILFTTGLFLSLHLNTFCQNSNQNIVTFCKVWGFLKYHHPLIANGSRDWDKEFLTHVLNVSELKNKQEINGFYLNWIESLGKIIPCKKCIDSLPEYIKTNHNINWITDTSLFTSPVISQLNNILKNRNQGKNYYTPVKRVLFFNAVSPNYSTEKAYNDSTFPSPALRLLTLSRYWNIVNYFYPYKTLINENWDSVLSRMAPVFYEAKDTLTYHLAIYELAATINDSHSFFAHLPDVIKYFGNKMPAIDYSVVENKVIVTGLLVDSLANGDDFIYGDVILTVDGQSIASIVQDKAKYIGASNKDCLNRDLRYILLNSDNDSAIITIDRNGTAMHKTMHRYYIWNIRNTQKPNDNKVAWNIIDDNIGYINMGVLQSKNISKAMKALKNTKGLILDIRNYPSIQSSKLAAFLNKEKRPFFKAIIPLVNYPGVYKYSKTFYTGKKNEDYYKGQIVIVMDERTQSHAELMVMELQTAPNVITVGNNTAGANGDVREIPLPGGYRAYMSSVGICYPDGRITQRTGIIPDVLIKPTIEGIRLKKDEILERAIGLINSKTRVITK